MEKLKSAVYICITVDIWSRKRSFFDVTHWLITEELKGLKGSLLKGNQWLLPADDSEGLIRTTKVPK